MLLASMAGDTLLGDKPTTADQLGRRGRFLSNVRQSPALYVMIGVVIFWAVLFHWVPIYGITIAFKRYSPLDGFFGGEWVGFRYVVQFINDPYFFRLVRNTVVLGFLNLLFGFPAPIILALLLNEVRNRKFKRIAQSISYLPHFIAIVIVVGLMYRFFSFDGVVTRLVEGLTGETIDFLGDPAWFRPLYIGSQIWQEAGWGTIIYLAAMASVNPELYESAEIDGAGRFQKVRFITLPGIMSTVVVLFILATRNIVQVGFEKAFIMQHPGIYETADVIATYVFRRGIEGGQFAYGTAIGLLNSAVSFAIVLFVNRLARRVQGEGLW
jgi:putative aldouronate transport system permease protein